VTAILRLASGGDGIGQLEDGRTVFVPRSAPGDIVELTRVREHRRYARARVGRLIHPSSLRVEPRCPHYERDECGGCQMQHLSAVAQRDARRRFAGDALRRIGRIDVEDPELVPAPSDWEYRTRLTLHADGERIGLHPLDRPAEVFDLKVCPITNGSLIALWREVSRRRHLLPSRLRHIMLRLDREGARHLIVETRGAGSWHDAPALAEELDAAGQPAVLWLRPEAGEAGLVSGENGSYPATVFEQVHPVMGDRARAYAVAALGELAGRHAWDLYAGIGETTEALLAAGASVESVEADRRAVAHAESRGVADPARVRRHTGRVEAMIGLLGPPRVVVTNPPRTGMDERVAAGLDASGAERIVYISCDPATLARDIGRLPAYRLAEVRAFDLFPQTAHVESVALLVPR